MSIDPYTTTPRGRSARASQPGAVVEVVRWLLSGAVWIAGVVTLSVVVIGAWGFSPFVGLVTTVFALIIAYFMVRER